MIRRRPSLEQALRHVGVDEAGLGRARKAFAAFEDAQVWYVSVFSGFAAWLSAILVLAFVYEFGLIQGAVGSLIAGAGLGGIASAARWQPATRTHPFANQLCLAGVVAAETMVGIGLLDLMVEPWGLLGTALVLVGMLFAYPDGVHRFGVTVASAAFLAAFLYEVSDTWPLHILASPFFAAGLASFVWEAPLEAGPLARLRAPVGFGALVSAFLLVMLGMWGPEAQQAYTVWTSVGLTAVSLVGLLWTVQQEVALPNVALGVAVVVVGGVGALTLSSPGVVAALAVLLLSFHRRHPLLFGIGSGFLALFLFWFYYDLSLSLYVKAGVLIGTGIVLWLARLGVVAAAKEAS